VLGSFDAARQGCTVVCHLASPFLIENRIDDGQKDVVETALWHEAVLDAVGKSGTVRLVILISSMAAIFGDNADVQKIKTATLFTDYFNTTSTVSHNTYSYSKRPC
jgi:nucleoside-diphosphate-sugar epimerase